LSQSSPWLAAPRPEASVVAVLYAPRAGGRRAREVVAALLHAPDGFYIAFSPRLLKAAADVVVPHEAVSDREGRTLWAEVGGRLRRVKAYRLSLPPGGEAWAVPLILEAVRATASRVLRAAVKIRELRSPREASREELELVPKRGGEGGGAQEGGV